MHDQTNTLLRCLTLTLDASVSVRAGANEYLNAQAQGPGFGVELLRIALAQVRLHRKATSTSPLSGMMQGLPHGERQLAAVLLRQYIRKHWTADVQGYEDPPVSLDDKAAMRQMLPMVNHQIPIKPQCTIVLEGLHLMESTLQGNPVPAIHPAQFL
jgi:importin-9